MILIITASNDVHVDRLQTLAKKQKIKVLRINSDEISSRTYVGYNNGSFVIQHLDKIIPLSTIKSAWWRKPFNTILQYGKMSNKAILQKKLKDDESKNILFSLFYELESKNILLINPRTVGLRAESKLYQLNQAKNVGFKIPNTIVSPSSEDIMHFIKNNSNQTITKCVGKGLVYHGNNFRTFFTADLSLAKANKYVLNKKFDYPIYIQEKIQKAFELRITVVGDKIFACKIDSQSKPEAQIDWRKVDPSELKHEPYKLPDHISNLCLDLCKKLGLVYGAIDMAVTPGGEYVFFEINPNGQYLWIEDRCNFPITKTILNTLNRGN